MNRSLMSNFLANSPSLQRLGEYPLIVRRHDNAVAENDLEAIANSRADFYVLLGNEVKNDKGKSLLLSPGFGNKASKYHSEESYKSLLCKEMQIICDTFNSVTDEGFVSAMYIAENVLAVASLTTKAIIVPVATSIFIFTNNLKIQEKFKQVDRMVYDTEFLHLSRFDDVMSSFTLTPKRTLTKLKSAMLQSNHSSATTAVLNYLVTSDDKKHKQLVTNILKGKNIKSDLLKLNNYINNVAYIGMESDAAIEKVVNQNLTVYYEDLTTNTIRDLITDSDDDAEYKISSLPYSSSVGLLRAYAAGTDLRDSIINMSALEAITVIRNVLNGAEALEGLSVYNDFKLIQDELHLAHETIQLMSSSLKDSNSIIQSLEGSIGTLIKDIENKDARILQLESQLQDALSKPSPTQPADELTKLDGSSYKISREEVSKAIVSNYPPDRIFHVDATIQSDGRTKVVCKSEDNSTYSVVTKAYTSTTSDQAEMAGLNDLLHLIYRDIRKPSLVITDSLNTIRAVRDKTNTYNVKIMSMLQHAGIDVVIQWKPRQLNLAGIEIERGCIPDEIVSS